MLTRHSAVTKNNDLVELGKLEFGAMTGPTTRIALSPDGSILATISTRDLQLW
jgi:hypothetical protein